MADPSPSVQNPWAQIARGQSALARDVRDLGSPTGTQLNRTTEKLVLPVAFSASDSIAFGAAAANYAVATIGVPDGYSRALVNASAQATLRSNDVASGWALLMCACGINGVYGPNMWASVDGQKYGNAGASFAAALEGLTAGSSIVVAARISFPGTMTLPRSAVSGSILFLR